MATRAAHVPRIGQCCGNLPERKRPALAPPAEATSAGLHRTCGRDCSVGWCAPPSSSRRATPSRTARWPGELGARGRRSVLPCAIGRRSRARAHRRIGQCCGMLTGVSHDRSSPLSWPRRRCCLSPPSAWRQSTREKLTRSGTPAKWAWRFRLCCHTKARSWASS